MNIVVAVLLVTAVSFSIHAFVMFRSRINPKITSAFVGGFVFISALRAALGVLFGYVVAQFLNRLNETSDYETPWLIFLFSLPFIIITGVYSFISYRNDVKIVQKRIEEFKARQQTTPDTSSEIPK